MQLNLVILGPGCPKCKMLKRHTQKAVELLTKAAPETTITVQTITDLDEILRYEVLSTPVLLINEHIVAVGKVLRTEEILTLLRAALADHASPTSGAQA